MSIEPDALWLGPSRRRLIHESIDPAAWSRPDVREALARPTSAPCTAFCRDSASRSAEWRRSPSRRRARCPKLSRAVGSWSPMISSPGLRTASVCHVARWVLRTIWRTLTRTGRSPIVDSEWAAAQGTPRDPPNELAVGPRMGADAHPLGVLPRDSLDGQQPGA